MKKVRMQILAVTLLLLAALLVGCGGGKNDATTAPDGTGAETAAPATSADGSDGVLRITKQPAALTEIRIPDGITLSVEVNDESLVESYRWQRANGVDANDEYYFVDLDGRTATSNTLIKPSTGVFDGIDEDVVYRCVVTPKEGEPIVSDVATVRTDAREIEQSGRFICLNIGEFALLPGKTFDLADTYLGTGTISLNERGDEATLTDVVFDNTNPFYDYYDTSLGLEVCVFNYPYETFTIRVNGSNLFTNSFFQPSTGQSGVPFCFNFLGAGNLCENVVFEGDGTLTVTGGTQMIYSNTKVTVDCDLTFNKVADHYTSGILASEIEIKEGVGIDANLNGFLFRSTAKGKNDLGDIRLCEGVTVNAICSIPPVMAGTTDFHVVSAMGSFFSQGAKLNVTIAGDYRRFESDGEGGGPFGAADPARDFDASGLRPAVSRRLGEDPEGTEATVFAPLTQSEAPILGESVGRMLFLQTHMGIVSLKDSEIDVAFQIRDYEVGEYYTFSNACFFSLDSETQGRLYFDGTKFNGRIDSEYVVNFYAVFAVDLDVDNGSEIVIDAATAGIVHGLRIDEGTISVAGGSTLKLNLGKHPGGSVESIGAVTSDLVIEDEGSRFVIDFDRGAAIFFVVGEGEEARNYEPDYEPVVLKDCSFEIDGTPVVNVVSTAVFDGWVYFETVFAEGDHYNPVGKIVFFTPEP